MKAVILAAGVGKRFGRRTAKTPKCLIPLAGKSLLERYFEAFRLAGIREAVIVVGHLREKVKRECRRVSRGVRVRFVTNPDYRRGSVLSLWSASRYLAGGALIMDADVFFPASALPCLLRSRRSSFLYDPRSVSAGEEMMILARGARIWAVSKKTGSSLKALGEATGLFRLDPKDAGTLRGILDGLRANGTWDVEYEEAYSELAKRTRLGKVAVGDVFWSEMDFKEDWRRISARLKRTDAAGPNGSKPTPRSPRRSIKAGARVSKG